MKQSIGAFVLKREHVEEGLISDRHLSKYAGIKVVSFAHDEFIHSEILRAGQKLSPVQLSDRRVEFASKLMLAGFKQKIAQKIASTEGACCANEKYLNGNLPLGLREGEGWNPYAIQQRYPFAETRSDGTLRNRLVVVPMPVGADITSHLTKPIVFKQAVILTDPVSESVKDFWSFYTEIPASLIKYDQDTTLQKLATVLHELRHTIQIASSTKDFFCEMDCDLFYRDIFRHQLQQFGIDPEPHLRVDLLARYASILHTSAHYQFAPALEEVEAGRPFSSPFHISEAITEICARIAEEDTGFYPLEINRKEFSKLCRKDPEKAYGLLRRCDEKGIFTNSPLTQHIATRVLEAVELFSEGLTNRPSVVNKIYAVREPEYA